MKKLIVRTLSLAILAATTSVFAGEHYKDATYKDMTPPPCQSWTGFYVGLNGGYGWGSQSVSESGSANFGAASIANAIKKGVIPHSLAGSPSGWLAGLQLAYDYQMNPLTVLGVEADYDWANIQDSKTTTTHVPTFAAFTTSAKQKLQSLATIRAVVGITPMDYPLLAYLTAGFGYGRAELTGSITNPGCKFFCGSNSTSNNNTGWVAGLGLQYAFLADWSAKAEYLYYNVGSQSQHILDPKFAKSFLGQSVSFKGNIVRVGVDYKFA